MTAFGDSQKSVSLKESEYLIYVAKVSRIKIFIKLLFVKSVMTVLIHVGIFLHFLFCIVNDLLTLLSFQKIDIHF